jgi:hypothetical protein
MIKLILGILVLGMCCLGVRSLGRRIYSKLKIGSYRLLINLMRKDNFSYSFLVLAISHLIKTTSITKLSLSKSKLVTHRLSSASNAKLKSIQLISIRCLLSISKSLKIKVSFRIWISKYSKIKPDNEILLALPPSVCISYCPKLSIITEINS